MFSRRPIDSRRDARFLRAFQAMNSFHRGTQKRARRKVAWAVKETAVETGGPPAVYGINGEANRRIPRPSIPQRPLFRNSTSETEGLDPPPNHDSAAADIPSSTSQPLPRHQDTNMKWIFLVARPPAFRNSPHVDVLTLKSGKIVHGFYEGVASEFIRFLTTEGLLTVNPMQVESMAICTQEPMTSRPSDDTIAVMSTVQLPDEFRTQQNHLGDSYNP